MTAEPQATTPVAERRWAYLCGVIGGVAGMAVADLAAYLLAPAGAPVEAVGSTIIDLLPAELVNWGKETLGTADKPVLLVIVALGVLALSGLAGPLERRQPSAGLPIFVAVALVGLIAVVMGGATPWAAFPTLLGLAAGYLVMRLLLRRLQQWVSEAVEDPAAGELSRRTFLIRAGVVAVAASAGAVVGRVLQATGRVIEEVKTAFRLPVPVKRDPVPAGADLALEELSPYLTPNAEFYRIDTALRLPIIAAEDWSLTITGMVEKEVTLTFAELLAKPLIEHVATLTCVSNEVGGGLIGNASWVGYPIRDLLAQARPLPGADMVLSRSQDGWTAGTPLSALTDPAREALLAIGMNGEPLPVEHGFPVRMVVPGLYGYVSATKWVREFKVTTFAKDMGYWTPRGWAALGPVKTGSRIDVPRRGVVAAGQVVVAGVAWDQHTGIERVEIGIDGDWREAELAEVTGPDTWRQWFYRWDATPGEHQVAVRATNAEGVLQTETPAPPAPDGATGWHTLTVVVG